MFSAGERVLIGLAAALMFVAALAMVRQQGGMSAVDKLFIGIGICSFILLALIDVLAVAAQEDDDQP